MSKKGENAISIARSLDVGKTQIQTIIRERDSILARWENGEAGGNKFSKVLFYFIYCNKSMFKCSN